MHHIKSFVLAAFILLLIQAARGLTQSVNTCDGGLYSWPFCNARDRSTRDVVRPEISNRSLYRDLFHSRVSPTDERRIFHLNRINRERYSSPKTRSLDLPTLKSRRAAERVESRRNGANDRMFDSRLSESRRVETNEYRRESNDRRDESRRNVRDRLYDRQVSRDRRVIDENQRLERFDLHDSRSEVARGSSNDRSMERRDGMRRENREYSRNTRNLDRRMDSERRSLSRIDTRREANRRDAEKREVRASSEYRAAVRREDNTRSDRRGMVRDAGDNHARNEIRETRERIKFERLENDAVFRKNNRDSSRFSRSRFGSRLSYENVFTRSERRMRERESVKPLIDDNNMERSRIELRTRQFIPENQVLQELVFGKAKESTKDILIQITRVVCFAVMVLQIYLAGRNTKTKQRFFSAIPFFQSTKLKEE